MQKTLREGFQEAMRTTIEDYGAQANVSLLRSLYCLQLGHITGSYLVLGLHPIRQNSPSGELQIRS